MPRLGLGLGLGKDNNYPGSAYNDLKRLSTWFIDPARPEGITGDAVAFNAKPANPIQDQAGKVGKNLLPVFPSTVTSNGITVTISSDGEITINGTATTGNFFKLTNGLEASPSRNPAWLNQTIAEGSATYTNSITVISGTKSDGSFGIRSDDDVATGIVTSTTHVTFTTSKRMCYAYIFFPIGTVFNNYKIKHQLELGSVATAYEPYGKANVLMTNVGWTSADGYRVEPLINDYKGSPVTFTNLLGNDGNMIDSNSDNRADGWNYNSATAVSCVGGEVVFLPNSQYGSISTSCIASVGDVVYRCAYVKSTSPNTRITINTPPYTEKRHSGSSLYEFLSILVTHTQASIINIIDSDLTTGFSNITVKHAHLFNLKTMFPDPNRRPTQAQMDSLVKDAIARYGYVNERIIKIAWAVGFKCDGSDTYGVVASNGPNPTSGDFAFAQTFRTASTLATQYLFARAEQSEATCQIGIKLTNTGVLSIILEGTNIQIATGLLVNTFYDLVATRIGGTLKALLNGVEVLSVANATVLTSRPNVRIGALSTNVGGTTHTGFTNVTLFPYGFTTTDEAKFATNWRKYVTKEYGL